MGCSWEERPGTFFVNIGTAENPDWVVLGTIVDKDIFLDQSFEG